MASTGDVTAALALELAARGGLEKDDLDGEGLEGEAWGETCCGAEGRERLCWAATAEALAAS